MTTAPTARTSASDAAAEIRNRIDRLPEQTAMILSAVRAMQDHVNSRTPRRTYMAEVFAAHHAHPRRPSTNLLEVCR